ncbi:phospholipase C/P1 nuclease [Tothia fuscella]|uniref:Phospholipase C/P1 nuclease n=1 Tax=Tothia fuscella TaxID=1048955 RepID=A0A9P4P2S6_9PEZI|nr:phospholipase C/P1 nuclease [Tothia fuscella]
MKFPGIVFGSLLLYTASAWNTDVHQQIGFMAEEFLTPYTIGVIRNILEPWYQGSIGRAAAWADRYAHTAEGRFSYQWHWIDSEDTPPTSCNVEYKRDCSKGGCVVSAIANQTSILHECIQQVKDGSLTGGSNTTCSQALKWVTHFLGDITQPLHSSGIAAGGNMFNVTFAGHATELHAVWDGFIPHADAGVLRFSNSSLSPFMAALVDRIRANAFAEPTTSWLQCINPATPVTCAMAWAAESNAWTCSYVYKQVYNNTDLLDSGYAQGAFPIIELQISKAALRLATWLNTLALGHYERDGQDFEDPIGNAQQVLVS